MADSTRRERPDRDVEVSVVRLLASAGATVAAAESVTAGRLTARLARVPGASRALRGGVVVYATETKHTVLGVPMGVLERRGPVSPEVTCELAARVRGRFGADYGLAVTGVAGPDPQGGHQVGTGFVAVAGPEEVEVEPRRIPGDRLAVQEGLVAAALELLVRALEGHDPPG